MAANLPEKLKTPDISRFAVRAAQLEKAKPVISYWCNYWVVNQILSKGLHKSDEESLKYCTQLMEKLEQFKTEHAGDESVTDDAAGMACVQQFAVDTLQRAENAIQAKKATLQTADTLQAAATFLELLQIWGDLEADIAAKVKFAKYHAVRIAKAVKAGEDPNLTSPPAESVEESKPPAEHNSPEIIVNQPAESEEQSERRRQPSVEEVPDDFDQVQHRLAQQSTLDESIHPSRSSSTAPRTRQDLPSMAAAAAPAAAPASGAASPTVFPTTLMDINSGTRQRPSYLSRAANLPDLPAAPSDFPSPASSGPGTPMHLGSPPEAFPRIGTLHSFPPPTPSALPPGISPFDTIQPHQPQPPTVPQDYSKGAHGQVPSLPPTSVSHRPPPTSVPPTTVQSRTAVGTTVDDEAIAQAQKHARWAVSALNFDDVTTAVKELRNALGLLGAS